MASLTSPSRSASDRALATHSKPGLAGPSPSTSTTRPHHAGPRPRAASGGASSQARSTSWSSNQSISSSSRSAASIGPSSVAVADASARSPSRATNWAAVIGRRARSPSDAISASLVVCRASTARVAAEAGLLISWARPAARVPSATSASRWRAVLSIRRTVLARPSMKCTPKANHSDRQGLQIRGGHPEHPPVVRPASGRVVDAVVVPRREATGPLARRRHHTELVLLVAHQPVQHDRALEQHPPLVGRGALVEELVAGCEDGLGADLGESPQLLVGEAVEQRDPAELGGVHHTLSR